jgi:hypothetical protein
MLLFFCWQKKKCSQTDATGVQCDISIVLPIMFFEMFLSCFTYNVQKSGTHKPKTIYIYIYFFIVSMFLVP